MKRIQKVLADYRFKGVGKYGSFAHGVVTQLSTSTYFKDGKDLAAPILVAADELIAFEEAHPQLTRPLTAEIQVLREAVLAALADAAIETNRRFAGNEAALLSTGFELTAEPQAMQPPVAPTLCEIVDGTASGSACIRIKRAPFTNNVKWYYTTNPALPIEQWQCELELTDELTVSGFDPGQRLYAKVACINSASKLGNLNFAEAKPRYVQ